MQYADQQTENVHKANLASQIFSGKSFIGFMQEFACREGDLST